MAHSPQSWRMPLLMPSQAFSSLEILPRRRLREVLKVLARMFDEGLGPKSRSPMPNAPLTGTNAGYLAHQRCAWRAPADL